MSLSANAWLRWQSEVAVNNPQTRMVERFSEKMRFSAKVQKRSGKTKCKNETAQSAKASLVYNYLNCIISHISAGVKRIYGKFAQISVYLRQFERSEVVSRPAPRINLRFSDK